ncbi:MAG: hypothetical protein MPJ78_19195 [Hyphomicrobiaceae bacterium]|nr:hypothetical protein [Hyphomicrobiaceae bacterium]
MKNSKKRHVLSHYIFARGLEYWKVLQGAAFALLLGLGAASSCLADTPQSFNANTVLPANLLSGPHHTVAPRTENDGRFNHYVLKTEYGSFRVRSTDLLRLRIRELDALAKMNKVRIPAFYLKAAGGSALAPANGAIRFVKNPGKGVRDAKARVREALGNIRLPFSGQSDGHKPDGLVSRLSGFSEAKRDVAARFGVDPYSTFQPLQTRLAVLARARMSGKLTTQVGYSFVTGPASIAISVGEGMHTLTEKIRDKSVGELHRENRAALLAMRVEPAVVNAFLANPKLSPTDKTIIVAAMKSLDGTHDRGVFVKYASRVKRADDAFAVRRRAEFTASYHSQVWPVRAFVQVGDQPAAKINDRRLAVIVPADYLTWTQATAQTVQGMNVARKKLSPRPSVTLVLAGSADRKSVKQLRKIGWQVKQNVRPSPAQ